MIRNKDNINAWPPNIRQRVATFMNNYAIYDD